jgi:hypothetical protein
MPVSKIVLLSKFIFNPLEQIARYGTKEKGISRALQPFSVCIHNC